MALTTRLHLLQLTTRAQTVGLRAFWGSSGSGAGNRAPAGRPSTLESQLGLPPKPKAPIAPYVAFFQATQPRVTKAGLKGAEAVKKVGAMWRDLPAAQKNSFSPNYKQDYARYKADLSAYMSKIGAENAEKLKSARSKIRADKKARVEKRSLKALAEQMNKPKRPLSSFFRFQESLGGKMSVEASKANAQAWKTASPAVRQKFQQEFARDQAAYEKALRLWEEKMLSAGHPKLVRAKFRPAPPKKASVAKKQAAKKKAAAKAKAASKKKAAAAKKRVLAAKKKAALAKKRMAAKKAALKKQQLKKARKAAKVKAAKLAAAKKRQASKLKAAKLKAAKTAAMRKRKAEAAARKVEAAKAKKARAALAAAKKRAAASKKAIEKKVKAARAKIAKAKAKVAKAAPKRK